MNGSTKLVRTKRSFLLLQSTYCVHLLRCPDGNIHLCRGFRPCLCLRLRVLGLRIIHSNGVNQYCSKSFVVNTSIILYMERRNKMVIVECQCLSMVISVCQRPFVMSMFMDGMSCSYLTTEMRIAIMIPYKVSRSWSWSSWSALRLQHKLFTHGSIHSVQ